MRLRITAGLVLALLIIPALAFAQSTTGGGNRRSIPVYQLTVTSNVRNADIYIDGDLQRADTPATFTLARGTYQVRVEARGYLPWSRTVSLNSNTTVNAELEPPYATIILDVPGENLNRNVRNPANQIDFYIDGEVHREARARVPQGWHDIAISSGGLWIETEVYLEAGSVYDLELILRMSVLQSWSPGAWGPPANPWRS